MEDALIKLRPDCRGTISAFAPRPARVVVPWCQDFYNVKRRHSSAALLAPDEYERIAAIQPDAA